ncbi:MAG: twin-arginine translocase TatA/TatE family subunit [Gemmatimonadaceae bacterium]|nr:twin-arginine translocase TatA/TatE family subunit [Gemmatimonadaceae bacterium]MCW5825443.1 twin-arginine translocase TatA/TatE family subunit [Gemmatimonadaceae bacterium]
MLGLGPTELFIGLIIVLLLFGAKRIPEIAGSFGKGIKEFKKNMNEVQAEIAKPAERESLPPSSAERAPSQESEQKEPKRLL